MPDRERPDPNKVNFKLNEPAKPIGGGSWRESTVVNREEFPQIARRERLNRLLLAHDPEVGDRNLEEITDEDCELLRQVAVEGAITGVEPALRKRAILYLGYFPTPENTNLLSELARDGEDAYVRGFALSSLARTGLELAIPLLCDALSSKDPIESRRAELGLVELGRKLGISRLRSAVAKERRKSLVVKLQDVFATLEGKLKKKRRKPRQTKAE